MDRLDDATKDALRAYVDGTVPHPQITPAVKLMIEVILFAEDNWDELEALREAEERGDLEKLAELVETKGELRTLDARAYVAARLREEKRTPGNKLTQENMLQRIRLYLRTIDSSHDDGGTQSDALRECLKRDGAFGKEGGSFETIHAKFKAGRSELREVLESLGFAVGPALLPKKTDGKVQ